MFGLLKAMDLGAGDLIAGSCHVCSLPQSEITKNSFLRLAVFVNCTLCYSSRP